MRPDKSLYELLGVDRRATTDQIKAAYREIARVYHPDSNFYDEIIDDSVNDGGMAVFKSITAAYNTLIHEEKRRQYDESLPPELKDWEGASGEKGNQEQNFQDWAHDKARQSGSYAMGTFGDMKRKPPSAFSAPTFGEPKSMAEMMGYNLPWYKRLLKKLGL